MPFENTPQNVQSCSSYRQLVFPCFLALVNPIRNALWVSPVINTMGFYSYISEVFWSGMLFMLINLQYFAANESQAVAMAVCFWL